MGGSNQAGSKSTAEPANTGRTHLPHDALRSLAHRLGPVLPCTLFVAGYIAVLLWFRYIDVYHRHFATSGFLTAAYNFFRLLFIFYLFCVIQAAGCILLRLTAGKALDRMGLLDRLTLAFFVGAGVWHVGMLALGYLQLYTAPVAIAITLPAVALSHRNLHATVQAAGQGLAQWRADKRQRELLANGLLASLCVAAGSALLLVKGLYPAGGHDYYTHYFYFYQTAIDHSGIWPNDVWYHYFYSKGAGLFFLAWLLTDPLAPQLVTFCFTVAAALALFLLLRRIAPGTSWPWVGVILFLALIIYTPGQGLHRSHGGWGDFEKLHELNASLIIAILWMTARAVEPRDRVDRVWLLGAVSASAAAVIVNTSIAVFLGAAFALAGIFYLIVRRRDRSLVLFGLTAIAGAVLIVLLAINYFTTGLINDQGILQLWRFADLDKLDAWGALPMALIVHWMVTELVAARVSFSFESIVLIYESLRLDLLYPLAGTGLAAAIIAAAFRRFATKREASCLSARGVLLAAFVLAFVVLALAVGRAQPISFYRYSSFALPMTIAAGIALWAAPLDRLGRVFEPIYRWAVPPLILAACLAAAAATYPPGSLRTVLTNAWRFATGAYSIDAAYAAQDGWPGRLAWGGVYPGARGAYAVAGPHTRIWSMHVHSYCMLPDCRIETYSAFIMTPAWDRVMFGTPEEGKAALQAAGLNYFLFSRELELVDALPLSALFAADTISRYFGIRWTDGTTALLTWRGPDTQPFDAAWLADYRRAVQASAVVRTFPYATMRDIYARLRATPHPWHSFEPRWPADPR